MRCDDVKAYYDAIYLGEPIEDANFPRYHARAADALDAATFGRWRRDHPPDVRDAIIRALCAQVAYLYESGASDATDGTGGSYTVGHVSVQSGSGASGSTAAYGGLCRSAVMMLAPTGLLYNGGDVMC